MITASLETQKAKGADNLTLIYACFLQGSFLVGVVESMDNGDHRKYGKEKHRRGYGSNGKCGPVRMWWQDALRDICKMGDNPCGYRTFLDEIN